MLFALASCCRQGLCAVFFSMCRFHVRVRACMPLLTRQPWRKRFPRWQKRKQEPEDNGTADISVVFRVALTPEERATIKWVEEQQENRHPRLGAWHSP